MALGLAFTLLSRVRGFTGKATFAGSLRRGATLVGDVDILMTPNGGTPPFTRLTEAVREVGGMEMLAGSRKRAYAIPLESPRRGAGATPSSPEPPRPGGRVLQVDAFLAPPESWATMLQFLTGSRWHNISLRGIAKSEGYRLNELGLFDRTTLERIPTPDEWDIYERLGLRWLPPRYREGFIHDSRLASTHGDP